MNRFNFELPSEIDSIRTNLSFLARNSGQVDYTPSLPTLRTPTSHDPTHTVSPQSVNQPLEVPIHSTYVPSNYHIEQQAGKGDHGVNSQSQDAKCFIAFLASLPAEPSTEKTKGVKCFLLLSRHFLKYLSFFFFSWVSRTFLGSFFR